VLLASANARRSTAAPLGYVNLDRLVRMAARRRYARLELNAVEEFPLWEFEFNNPYKPERHR